MITRKSKDFITNLQNYVDEDFTYQRYKKNPNEYFNDFEYLCINHCQDIQWAIDEIKALCELVQEMKKKYEKI